MVVQFGSGHIFYDRFQLFRDTQVSVAVAIFATWNAFAVVPGIPNKEWHTFFALWP